MEKDGRRHVVWCLNGKNYASWKFGMKLALQSVELWEVVNGTQRQPAERRNADQVIENAADITNWNKRNTTAMQNIFGAIKEDQSRILMSCSTAQEMWMKLETEYEEDAADNAPLLWTKFYGCTFRPSQSVSSFLTELEQIAFRLKSLNIAIDDNQIMAKILMSLPPEFRVFAFAWDSTPVAEKTLKKLTTRLIALDKSLRNDEEAKSTSDTAYLSKPNRDESQHKEQALPAQYGQNKGKSHPSSQHAELNAVNTNAGVREKEKKRTEKGSVTIDMTEEMINYVSSQEQLADALTKPLAAPRFKYLRDKIGVRGVGEV
ncbi:uncharacterized protein LOC124200527 [Daphnia pulex]|uniref:uncharacterized protein LOC124200527 n=1 Tax=Daphnia pulex TaxID=6669 RepID=UPI001EDEC333|nr:uncharacterized protein LOC124200527 [Daphnia pulex]